GSFNPASAQLSWGKSAAGNTAGFGQVWDKRPFWTGDFNGDGRAEVLFYYPEDKNWWMSTFDGNGKMSWGRRPPGNTRGLGQVGDGRPIWTGDFDGDGKQDLLFYHPGDRNWWFGNFDSARITLPRRLTPGQHVAAYADGQPPGRVEPVVVQH